MLTHRPLPSISLLLAAAKAMATATSKDPFTHLENGIIRMRMDHTGPTNKAAAHQEMPDMFVDYSLSHLMSSGFWLPYLEL